MITNITKLVVVIAGAKIGFVQFLERLIEARSARTGWNSWTSIVTPDTRFAPGFEGPDGVPLGNEEMAKPEQSLVAWLKQCFGLNPEQAIEALRAVAAAHPDKFYFGESVNRRTGEVRVVKKTGQPAFCFGRVQTGDPFAVAVPKVKAPEPAPDPFAASDKQ